MKVGTKSVLFGVHQFLWHPFTVLLAWRKLYGTWPAWWQCIAIFCHDLGYWGKPNMDGPEGELHPVRGAEWAGTAVKFLAWCGWRLRGVKSDVAMFLADLVALEVMKFSIYHSRYFSFKHGAEPSDLAWADKLCVWYDPAWFYLLRANLSGEIKEYRRNATKCVPEFLPDSAWLFWYRNKVTAQVAARLPATEGHHIDGDNTTCQ